MKIRVFVTGFVAAVVTISVIIATVFWSPFRSEILTALVTAGACGLTVVGMLLGWAMSMLMLRRMAQLVGAADRGFAAQMQRDKENIKIWGRPTAGGSETPALGPGEGQPWLPPLQNFQVYDAEFSEVDNENE